MSYRPGKSARKMYRHKARYGTAGMSKRQLRALAREMDIGVNPKRRRGKKHRAQHSSLTRERGGHEEGGWYYDDVQVSHRKAFRRPGAAAAYAKRMARRHAGSVNDTVRRGVGEFETWQHGRRGSLLRESGRPEYNPGYYRGRRNTRRYRNPQGNSTLLKRYWALEPGTSPQNLLIGRGIRTSMTDAEEMQATRLARKITGERSPWGRSRRGRNPKRDGTPTRGEKRRSKYETHLAAIVQRGEETKAKLKLVKRAPIGKKTPHHYEEHAPLKPHVVEAAELREIPSAPAAERAEISDAMHELNEAHAHLLGRLKSMDEGAPDDEVELIQGQIADIAKQKKKLREATAAPVMSNPRPRGGRRYHLRGLASYGRALRRYCNAIHAYCRR